jgi:hypothetical protein
MCPVITSGSANCGASVPKGNMVEGVATIVLTPMYRLILVFGEPLKKIDQSDTLLQDYSAGGGRRCLQRRFFPYRKDWKSPH